VVKRREMISLTSFPENLFAISSIHNEDRFLGMRIDDPDHSEVVLFVGHHGVEFDGAITAMVETGVAINRDQLIEMSQAMLATAMSMIEPDDFSENGESYYG